MRNNNIKNNEINNIICDILDNYNGDLFKFERLNYCQAQYQKYYGYNEKYNIYYKVFVSYCTIVAIELDTDDDLRGFYELGKWSRTTSRQVTQYYNKYSELPRYYIELSKEYKYYGGVKY